MKSCAKIRAADKGKQIHDEIATCKAGVAAEQHCAGQCSSGKYAKCNAVSKARQVLDGLPTQNVVSWSALIVGNTQGHAKEALKLSAKEALNFIEEMQRAGILLDAMNFVCILKACATIGATDEGKQIHEEIARQGLLQNGIVLGNALVDMYAKCGVVSKA